MLMIRQYRHNNLPAEPLVGDQDIVTIRFCFPDGDCRDRDFYIKSSIQVLFDYVGSDHNSSEVFRVFTVEYSIHSTVATGTVGDIIGTGTRRLKMYVEWLPLESDNSLNGILHLDNGNMDADNNNVQGKPSHKLIHVLNTLEAQVLKEDDKNIINVDRENVLDGGFRGFSRKSFAVWRQIDTCFSGESGIDSGGPAREFMRLANMEIAKLPIFSGPPNARNFTLDQNSLSKGTYRLAGIIMGHCIINRGPRPNYLSRLAYSIIVNGTSATPVVEDVDDWEQKQNIQAIRDSTTNNEFLEAVKGCEEMINLAGCFNIARYSEKDNLIMFLLKFLMVDRQKEAIDQFLSGLETVSIVSEVRKLPKDWEFMFVYNEVIMTASTVEELFTVAYWSENSERNKKEKRTLTHWRDFLQDLEEGEEHIHLSDILIYATGSDKVPPLGFMPEPKLIFQEGDANNPETVPNFPYGNTCANSLTLPMLAEYNVFKANMISGIGVKVFTAN